MSVNDGYGDAGSTLTEDETLAAYTKWLHTVANALLHPSDERHDDLVQEGRIAMWRALATYDPAKGALPTWLTTAAKMRMRDMAHGSGQPTGKEAARGKKEVQPVASVDALLDGGVEDVVGVAEALDGVEMSYHHGEIWKALEALPEAQRKYVFARFWAGLDPTSGSPDMRALVATVPELRKRRLWSGDNSMVGARDRLAKALAHLVDA